MINPGDIYESCGYHPVLCTQTDDDGVWGVSLIDGSFGHGCDINHCGVRELTIAEAMAHKNNWVDEKESHPYWRELFKRDGIL